MHRQRDFLLFVLLATTRGRSPNVPRLTQAMVPGNRQTPMILLVDGCHRASRWFYQAAILRVDLYDKVQHRRHGGGR